MQLVLAATAAATAEGKPRPGLVAAAALGPTALEATILLNAAASSRQLEIGTCNPPDRLMLAGESNGNLLPVQYVPDFAAQSGCTTMQEFLAEFCGKVVLVTVPEGCATMSLMGDEPPPFVLSREKLLAGCCMHRRTGEGGQCPMDAVRSATHSTGVVLSHYAARERPGKLAHYPFCTLELVSAAFAGLAKVALDTCAAAGASTRQPDRCCGGIAEAGQAPRSVHWLGSA